MAFLVKSGGIFRPLRLLSQNFRAKSVNTLTATPQMCSRGYCSSDEVKMAQSARKKTGEKTVFEKIVDRELPANIIYEDEQTMAFHGLHPTAPVHFLVIPKKLITMLEEAEDSDEQILGRLLLTARKVAKQEGLTNGYRVVINNGPDGAQSIYHLHLHVIGGRQLDWPPG